MPADRSAADTGLAEDFDLRQVLLHGRRLGARDRVGSFARWYRQRRAEGVVLHNRVVTSPVDRAVTVHDPEAGEEREMLMFGSNSYLGLTSHPYVRERAAAAAAEHGAGVGGVPLLSGYSRLHAELEERMSAFKGKEATVLFQSGYGANVGLLGALVERDDTAFYDALSHASTIDGLRMAAGASRRFRHNDAADLDRLLAAHDGGAFVCVEGVYSMDGDLGALGALVPVAQRHGALVVLDDAHGTGVTGRGGRGTADHFGVTDGVDAIMGTFSKAFGVTGAAVSTSRDVADYLRYFARSYVFSSSIPPPSVAAVLAGLDLLERDTALVDRLRDNSRYLAGRLHTLGFEADPDSAVFALLAPEAMDLRRAGRFVHEAGIFGHTIEYPAVSTSKQRFRFSVMATHTREDLDRLVAVIEEVWDRFADGVPRDAAPGSAAPGSVAR
jgi:glycine C-acetyltransferase